MTQAEIDFTQTATEEEVKNLIRELKAKIDAGIWKEPDTEIWNMVHTFLKFDTDVNLDRFQYDDVTLAIAIYIGDLEHA